MEKTIVELIEQICREKKIPKEKVLETLEQALAAAFRKDFGQKNQNIKTTFDPETGKIRVFDIKTVVEDQPLEKEPVEKESNKTRLRPSGFGEVKENEKRFNPKTEIEISEAKKLYPEKKIKIGEEIKTELSIPAAFGRIAAQTAKQVIIQRLKEVERELIFEKFKQKENQVVEGIVQKRAGQLVLVNIDNLTALLPISEQIEEENYLPGQRLKLYILSVQPTSREPEIIVTRRDIEILRQLFISEVPEVASGAIEIKKIAREPGIRSKVAVATKEKKLDPVGACIGQRGIRIQTITSALNNERIDVIEYSDDQKKFVANALSPAKIISLEIDEEKKTAKILVKKDQMSLAIGRRGLNLHLASELAGYKIELQQEAEPRSELGSTIGEERPLKTEEVLKKEGPASASSLSLRATAGKEEKLKEAKKNSK